MITLAVMLWMAIGYCFWIAAVRREVPWGSYSFELLALLGIFLVLGPIVWLLRWFFDYETKRRLKPTQH